MPSGFQFTWLFLRNDYFETKNRDGKQFLIFFKATTQRNYIETVFFDIYWVIQ